MYFLATTAIERFWNKEKQILFLHEGCCRFSRKAEIARLNFKVMPNIWADNNRIQQSFILVEKIYENILKNLSNALNELHQVSYSKRYWQIIIGRWLHTYIFDMYDRYCLIREALRIDANLETIILDESCYVIPNDTDEFYKLISEDFYNLQMFSQILKFIKLDCLTKKIVYRDPLSTEYYVQQETFSEQYERRNEESLVMNKSYFSGVEELLFTNKCDFIVKNCFESQPQLPLFFKDDFMRNRITLNMTTDTEFETLIISLIKNNIPLSFVEGYSYIEHLTYTLPMYQVKPKGIFSCVSFDSDVVFNQWAAWCAEKGTKLLSATHAVAISIRMHSLEEHLQAICDMFYKSGLVFPEEKLKTKILPAPRFIGRAEVKISNSCSDILFVTTNLSRTISYGFKFAVDFSGEEYFKKQRLFFATLTELLQEHFRVRLYVQDYGNDCIARWKNINNEIVIENWEKPLVSRMQECKVVVCDNFQTTFHDALALNIPVVLYYDYRVYKEFFHTDAVHCFEELERVGILYSTPEQAAKLLNEKYDIIEQWWQEPERQKVRSLVCKTYLGMSESATDQWIREFNNFFSIKEKREKSENLTEYFQLLPQNKIALWGASDLTEYFIQIIQQLSDKQIIGVIDDRYQGGNLLNVQIFQLKDIFVNEIDCIIINDLQQAKVIEEELSRYVPKRINIINPARDFPERLFREMFPSRVW